MCHACVVCLRQPYSRRLIRGLAEDVEVAKSYRSFEALLNRNGLDSSADSAREISIIICRQPIQLSDGTQMSREGKSFAKVLIEIAIPSTEVSIRRLGYAPIALQESLVHIVSTIPCAIIELSKSQHVHDLG